MKKGNIRKSTIKKRKNVYKRITAYGLSAMMLFSSTLAGEITLPVQAASESAEQYNITENGEVTYVAVMKNNASYERVTEKAENMDVLAEEQPEQLKENHIAVLEMDGEDVEQIEQIKGVVALEEDIMLTANEEVPIDEEKIDALVEDEAELPFSQWNLDAVNLPDKAGLTGNNVKVAVLDSGVTAAEDVLVSGYVDLTGSNNENPFFNDATGHGTSIASLIGASGIGDMDGIAPDAEANMEFIRQLFMASANQEAGGSNLGILNIGEAISMADNFQVQEEAAKIEPKAPSVTTYDTSAIVSGSWGGQRHHDMVSVLGDNGAIKIAANVAQMVDDYYHGDESKRFECKALHGVHNYVANLRFLYDAARNADDVAMTDDSAVIYYINGLNVPHSKDKTYGNSDINNLRQVVIDACTNPNGLGGENVLNADTKKRKRYVILGLAAHLIGDTFAHRTMIPEGLTGGSSRGSKTFDKSHFKNWNDFYDRYQKTYVEFRDINKYLKNGQENLYTDRVDFLPNRFEASKDGVANMFQEYENENPFSASKFLIETGFAKKLNNFNGYLESAGEGAIAGNLSTSNYRIDAADGKIATNEKDYVDYNHSIYNQ